MKGRADVEEASAQRERWRSSSDTLVAVIVTMHVASGAAAGAALRSRRGAVAAGLLLHVLADSVPHQDIASLRFEVGSGVLGLLAVAARRGPVHPATIGALASSIPDLEHLIRLPRPGGRKLFPSHRFAGWHKAGGIPAWAQLVLAGALIGTVARFRPSSP